MSLALVAVTLAHRKRLFQAASGYERRAERGGPAVESGKQADLRRAGRHGVYWGSVQSQFELGRLLTLYHRPLGIEVDLIFILI
jgi:hypothetical protein